MAMAFMLIAGLNTLKCLLNSTAFKEKKGTLDNPLIILEHVTE